VWYIEIEEQPIDMHINVYTLDLVGYFFNMHINVYIVDLVGYFEIVRCSNFMGIR